MKKLTLIITLATLVAMPINTSAQFGKKLKEKMQKLKSKNESETNDSDKYDAQGVTSPTHKKYQNKIVFSTNVINFKDEDQSQFKKNFVFGDDINFRIYMDDSHLNKLLDEANKNGITTNELEEYGTYMTVFYLDGKKVHSSMRDTEGMSLKAKSQWTTFKGEYFLKVGGDNSSGMQDFIDVISKIEQSISAGTHEIKVEIYPYIYVSRVKKNIEIVLEKPISTGIFNLLISKPFIKANANILCKTPKRGMTELEIEKKLKGTAKSITITGNTWKIYRHSITGIPLRRETYAMAGMKSTEGTCWYQEITIVQEYNGSTYENPTIGENIKFIPIPCSCLD